MTACTLLESAAQLGEFVGGFATLAALMIAIREVRKWREQRRTEKRSDAAGKALLAVRLACATVHNWCMFLVMEAQQDRASEDARRQGVEAMVNFGHRDVEALRRAIRQADVDAYLYLVPEERKFLSDAEGLLAQVDADATWWAERIGQIERDRLVEEFVNLSRVADAIRGNAERVLLPIARFD